MRTERAQRPTRWEPQVIHSAPVDRNSRRRLGPMQARIFFRQARVKVLAMAIIFFGLAFSTQLEAQTQAFTATLSGTISDSTGALLSGAKITLTSTERN